MIVPVMAILNLVLTRQIYSEEINGVHAHNCDRVPLITKVQFNFPENNYLWPTVSQHTKICPFEIASEELKGGRNIFR